MYLYDDDWKEHPLVVSTKGIITCAKVIGKETLLYGTFNNYFIVFDIINNIEIARVKFKDSGFINKIEILPHNRCLLIKTNFTSEDEVKICDLGDLKSVPKKKFLFDKLDTFHGVFSNGDVPLFSKGPKGGQMLNYNIITGETIYYDLGVHGLEFLGISFYNFILMRKRGIERGLLVFG
jgi:hypothetical protein